MYCWRCCSLTLIAVSLAIVADLLNNAVRDPEQIERTLSTEVIGTLPAVEDWQAQLMAAGETTTAWCRAISALSG
jgi:hypothetical protein